MSRRTSIERTEAPVRVGWIVDAQPEFLEGEARLHVPGADGKVKVAASEAVATLARAVGWIAGRCGILTYTVGQSFVAGREIPATGPGAALESPHEDRAGPCVIAAIRPAGPLVLGRDAADEEAEVLGYRAIQEGRPVVAHRRRGGVLEETNACRSFLAAVEDAFVRPVEVLVVGVAPDGSLARVVDGLLSHGHRVTVVRDAIFTTRAGPQGQPVSAWAGGGTVGSMDKLRESARDFAQISFADLEIAEAYEHLDRVMGRPSVLTPLARLDAAIPWELYRVRLETVEMNLADRVGQREPLAEIDALVMFKSMLLGAVYELSDDHLEFLLHDRLSFKRFAGLGVTDEPPSARLLRIQRQRWTRTGSMTELVADVDSRWQGEGYRFRGLRGFMRSSSSAREGVEYGGLAVPGSEPARWMAPKGDGGKPAGGGGKKRLSRRQRRKRHRKRKRR